MTGSIVLLPEKYHQNLRMAGFEPPLNFTALGLAA
jgi:hypothetical protein